LSWIVSVDMHSALDFIRCVYTGVGIARCEIIPKLTPFSSLYYSASWYNRINVLAVFWIKTGKHVKAYVSLTAEEWRDQALFRNFARYCLRVWLRIFVWCFPRVQVYGEMAHDGARFLWQHSYSRVYPVEETYSPYGVFMSFDHYNVEVRERVKCISGIEGRSMRDEPASER
jgi:hypothetical protein